LAEQEDEFLSGLTVANSHSCELIGQVYDDLQRHRQTRVREFSDQVH
jgi:uncharacterized protein involved in propanediol utilization